MAKPKNTNSESASLALPEQQTALVVSETDALAGVLDDMGVSDDGLAEVGAEDIKLPTKVWNFKGLDPSGEPIPPTMFYDTVTEQTVKSLDLVLINLHKTNEWREYVQVEDKSVVRCRSFDQVTGTMEDGTQRACKGCPDAQWTTDADGKRGRRCGPVYNVFAAEIETRQPCVLRFKRTSLPVIQAYLNKHHIGRRNVNGKRANWPLFVFRCKATLKMSDNKKYALPVLEQGGALPRELIQMGAETVQYVKDVLLGELNKVIDGEREDNSAESGDTSFEPGKFAAAEGQDFVG